MTSVVKQYCNHQKEMKSFQLKINTNVPINKTIIRYDLHSLFSGDTTVEPGMGHMNAGTQPFLVSFWTSGHKTARTSLKYGTIALVSRRTSIRTLTCSPLKPRTIRFVNVNCISSLLITTNLMYYIMKDIFIKSSPSN